MTDHSAPAALDADQMLRNARIIGLSLGAGVTLFALVVAYLHRAAPVDDGGGVALLYIWIGTAVSLCAVSIMYWRHAVAGLIEPRRAAAPSARAAADAGTVLSGVVVSWALVEAAAMFGVVVYFLTGIALAGLAAVALMWAALSLTWPQPEWFAAATAAETAPADDI